MSLVTLKEILAMASSENAIGSFSVINNETITGAILAAEKNNTPIILQVAEVRLKNKDYVLLGTAMVAAGKKAKVPVCVHFDHGSTRAQIEEMLKLGFTSVMYDGSHLPYEENIKNTKEIVELAKSYGASCEGELGKLGLSEDESEDLGSAYTNPAEAKDFVEKTGVDALAVSIGNQHGMHTISLDEVDTDRLKEIHALVDVPLVLHGGSNLSDDTFRLCIKNGIRKVNIASAIMTDVLNKIKDKVDSKDMNYFILIDEIKVATEECVDRHIKIFSNK